MRTLRSAGNGEIVSYRRWNDYAPLFCKAEFIINTACQPKITVFIVTQVSRRIPKALDIKHIWDNSNGGSAYNNSRHLYRKMTAIEGCLFNGEKNEAEYVVLLHYHSAVDAQYLSGNVGTVCRGKECYG